MRTGNTCIPWKPTDHFRTCRNHAMAIQAFDPICLWAVPVRSHAHSDLCDISCSVWNHTLGTDNRGMYSIRNRATTDAISHSSITKDNILYRTMHRPVMLLEYMPATKKINSPPSFDGGICSNQAFRCLRFAVEHAIASDSARYTSLTVAKKIQKWQIADTNCSHPWMKVLSNQCPNWQTMLKSYEWLLTLIRKI